MIAVIDYQAGNIKSVAKALMSLSVSVTVTRDAARLKACSGIVLPGVGAFAFAMASLRDAGLTGPLRDWAGAGKPFLGICLGYQLLFESSEEHGATQGLELVRGHVRRLPAGTRIPHMGWNRVRARGPGGLLDRAGPDPYFYFAHSYYPEGVPEPDVAGLTDYGPIEFVSAIARGRLWGAQFHPEKSGPTGLALLRNFCLLCGEEVREEPEGPSPC